ncbi:hypothetical protein [Polyangium sp. 15x6]|uniref:hypothetical protein n=1 Tax=Polyangium sp. 15x6 TaxID=3042687 RepID=UPI00249B4C94|nr:hypothetical protein [Polyangium sp. 15x6]MDI3291917.1 hypothetical protein [Polyangium sp. 15x6]
MATMATPVALASAPASTTPWGATAPPFKVIGPDDIDGTAIPWSLASQHLAPYLAAAGYVPFDEQSPDDGPAVMREIPNGAQTLLSNPEFFGKASAVARGDASDDAIAELLALAKKAGFG